MVDKKVKSRYNKTYYYKHRESLLRNLQSHITCKCGCTITKGNLSCHRKTKKHQKLLTKLSQCQTPISQTH